KPAAPPSTDSGSVAVSSTKNVTEYHAVALVSSHKVTLILQTRPYRNLRHPCCPIFLRHPYLPKGARGGSGGLPLGANAALPRRPICAGDIDCCPYLAPSLPLAPRSTLATLSAQGAKGAQGAIPQPACRSTDCPPTSPRGLDDAPLRRASECRTCSSS